MCWTSPLANRIHRENDTAHQVLCRPISALNVRECIFQGLWGHVCETQNDLRRSDGHSPYKIMNGDGKTPLTIDVGLLGNLNNLPLLLSSYQHHRLRQGSRRAAGQAYEEVQANRKLRQAQVSIARARAQYKSGDLVWHFRRPNGSKKVGASTGQWFGPALVLLHKVRRDGDLTIPGGLVWIVANDSLLNI